MTSSYASPPYRSLPKPLTTSQTQQTDEHAEDGEVAEEDEPKPNNDATTIVPNKIHIRGVDSLHTDDIKAYVKSHFGDVDKIEWIDDTSANLVFSSEPTAREAIAALSAVEITDASALPVGEAVPAKPLADKPETTLTVRFAVVSDRKERGAALRSRYYLLHPEHDPEEKRRRREERPRYRNRDSDQRSYRRRDDDDQDAFDASMYDDAPRRRSTSRDNRRNSYSRENRGKELFADRGSRRNRSASPMRDDTVMGGSDDVVRNREAARSIRDRISSSNKNKELFPSKTSSSVGQLDKLERAIGSAHLRDEDMPKMAPEAGFAIKSSANQDPSAGGFSIKGTATARELFPAKLGGESNAGKELFDSKSKQRQKAQDLFG